MNHAAPTFEVNLTNCDREPIHLSNAVQPHGVLLVASWPEMTILQISANGGEVFDSTAEELLGRSVLDVFDEESSAMLRQWALDDASQAYACRLAAQGAVEDKSFDATIHRTNAGLIIELEPAPQWSLSVAEIYERTRTAMARLQAARGAPDLCRCAAIEVRSITGFDRVMVYRFDRNDNGHVVAEAMRDGLESYLDLHYPASDIPAQARRLYTINRLRTIADTAYTPVPIVPAKNPVTGDVIDLSFSILRSVSPIHIEYLGNMGVGASMSISLIVNDRLWGMVICHHYQRKCVPQEVRAACDLLSQTLSWQVASAERNDRVVRRAESAERLRKLVNELSDSANLEDGLTENHVLLLALVEASGAALMHAGRLTFFGSTPSESQVLALMGAVRSADDSAVFCTERCSAILENATQFSSVCAGVLAVRLDRDGESYLVWFRPEVRQTVNWAGDPQKTVSLADGEPRLSPRGSFAIWTETVRDQSLPWQPWQVDLAVELGHAIASIVLRRASTLEELNRDLRSTTDALTHANLAKDDFLANISHELRNPLNAMLGWLRLLRGERLDPSRRQQALQIVERNAQAQARLIEDLLDVSRIISGKLRLDVQAVNLLEVAQAAVDNMRPAAEAKSIQLQIVLDPRASIITGDAARLQQVVWNLLANAVKFTRPGGRISLHLTRTDSSASITVSDNGEGIDIDFLPHVFERFRQAQGGSDRPHPGLGLGLAIVRHLVELHAGSVSAFSEGKGHGAIFTIHLPLSPLMRHVSEDRTVPNDAPYRPPQLAGIRVLVVDDEPDARQLMAVELERCGVHVETVASAGEALEAFRVSPPDVLISDIGMPGTDGYGLIEAVRRLPHERARQTPAIALTAYAASKDRARAFLSGFQAHLSKPVELAELFAVLANVCGRFDRPQAE